MIQNTIEDGREFRSGAEEELMMLGKYGVLDTIQFNPIPTSFIKIPDFPTSFFISKNPELRNYVQLKSPTEIDPEYHLQPTEIELYDDLDPYGKRKELIFYDYLRNTPGLSHFRQLLSFQIEENFYLKKKYSKWELD